jgi:hypothetical protein
MLECHIILTYPVLLITGLSRNPVCHVGNLDTFVHVCVHNLVLERTEDLEVLGKD